MMGSPPTCVAGRLMGRNAKRSGYEALLEVAMAPQPLLYRVKGPVIDQSVTPRSRTGVNHTARDHGTGPHSTGPHSTGPHGTEHAARDPQQGAHRPHGTEHTARGHTARSTQRGESTGEPHDEQGPSVEKRLA